ncbi:MAG: hypothetical protein M3R17_21240 [Bacteroidota bacterium]|nr:hypothetical protein [Bacteroidota bacterium]
MKIGIYAAIIIVSLIVRLIIWAVKNKSATPPTYTNNQYPKQGQPMKQPPPYIPPSQQQATDFSSLFDEQKSSYEQKPNAFTNTTPSTPSFKDPFDEQQAGFSTMTNRNTNSNMGAGSQSYYCMYCGKKFQSTAALKMDTCFKHPKSDQGLQKHVMYTGAGKPNIGF